MDRDVQDVSVLDPTRKCFADMKEFDAYLASHSNDAPFVTGTSVGGTEKSIIDEFITSTVIGSILNKKLEFQIGDTIYKYSKSGYCIFAVKQTEYAKAMSIMSKEKDILKRLNNYSSTEYGKYQIADGIVLYYTGDPIIEVTKKTSVPLTRISVDGRTKVQASFWRSKTPIRSSCGVKVEAWSRENQYEDFSAADTDLELAWDLQFSMPAGLFPNPSAGLRDGHGSVIKEELHSCGGYFEFNMLAGSIIGSAKCWDNTWISANVKK